MLKFLLQKIEPLISFLDHIGLKKQIEGFLKNAWAWTVTAMGTIFSSAYMAWLWLYSLIPTWAVPLVGLITFGLIVGLTLWLFKQALGVIEQFVVTRNRLTFDKSKYREFGQKLLDLHRDLSGNVIEMERELSTSLINRTDPLETWELKRAAERLALAKSNERFGPRIQDALLTLSRLGVPVDPVAFRYHDISRTAQYFGLIGELLKSDRLNDARTLTRDELWHLF
jgi:hypothetical protein